MVDTPDLMGDVRALVRGIGPRPATSRAEQQAHAYAATRLEQMGARVTIEPFCSNRTFSWPWLLVGAVLIVAGLLLWWPEARWAAAALGVLGAGLFWGMASCNLPLRFFLPRGESRNVVGVIPPKGPVRHHVVVLAHADSTRSALLWHPAQVRRFGANFRLNAMLAASIAVVGVLGALAPSALPWPWLGLPGLAGMLYGAGLLVHREVFGVWVEGANDNASGVALALGLAEHHAAHRLWGTELWCVVTGCEEVGSPAGAEAFMRAHGTELAAADWLVVDNVGAGLPRLLAGEGYPRFHRAAPDLLSAARRIGQEHPELGVDLSRVPAGAYTDAHPILARGLSGLAVWCEQDGILPNWHWPSDTLANVDPAAIKRVFMLCRWLLSARDAAQTGPVPEAQP